MDVTSSFAGDQLQPRTAGPQSGNGPVSLSLVNVGISAQNPLPAGAEVWNPNGDSVKEKQGSKLLCEVYRNDVLVRFDLQSVPPPGGCVRGDIKAASRESLNRLFLLSNNADVPFNAFATLTVQENIWPFIPVQAFKDALRAYLIRQKRAGLGADYIWVREHQKNGAPHFHVLHTGKVESSYKYYDKFGALREIDRERSRDLSIWWTEQLARSCVLGCKLCQAGRFVECDENGGWCGSCFRKMAYPKTERNGFMGCARIEPVRSEENAGAYLSKECSKRLQKLPPALWQRAGRWWGASRGLKATPVKHVYIEADELFSREVQTDHGTFEAVAKLQYGLGKRMLDKGATVEPKLNQGENA